MGVADTSYNLARNWMNWGHPANGPCAGCLAVSRHHVAKILHEGSKPGKWLIEDGNDGPNRIHERDLRWATNFRAP